MPKMHIERSVLIDAPIEKVYKAVSDFHTWTSWSPWLISEPEAKVDIRADGKYYEWDGKRVGSGNMQVLKEVAPNRVDFDLNFLKPWKSSSKVEFHCQEKNSGTKVTWTMNSSLPFFMFWMKKSMEAFVGSDYERGLAMLKDYIEKGQVESKLEFHGVEPYQGFQYIGIRTETTQDRSGRQMERDFTRLMAFADEASPDVTGGPFSIYHKWDMVKGKVAYTAGIPIRKIPPNLPADLVSGTIPDIQVYTLRHIGPYKHLGNAWTTMYSMHRNKEIKLVKGIDPFETYGNMPGEVPDSELITDIHFAVK